MKNIKLSGAQKFALKHLYYFGVFGRRPQFRVIRKFVQLGLVEENYGNINRPIWVMTERGRNCVEAFEDFSERNGWWQNWVGQKQASVPVSFYGQEGTGLNA